MEYFVNSCSNTPTRPLTTGQKRDQYILIARKPVSFNTAKTPAARNVLEAIRAREVVDDLSSNALTPMRPSMLHSHQNKQLGTIIIGGNQNFLPPNAANNNNDNNNSEQFQSLFNRWSEGLSCFSHLENMSAPKNRKKTPLYFKNFDSNTNDDSSDFKNSKIHKWMKTSAATEQQQRNYDRNDYERELSEIFGSSERTATYHDTSVHNKLVDRSEDYLEIQHHFPVAQPYRRCNHY